MNFIGFSYISTYQTYLWSGTDACASLCRLMPALNFDFFLGDSNIVIYGYS